MENSAFVKMKSELESEFSSINIFSFNGFDKLYSDKNIIIKIHQNINEFEKIVEFLKFLNINFQLLQLTEPESFLEPDEIETLPIKMNKDLQLTFGLSTNFQCLYILIKILKKIGLKKVFYSNENENLVWLENHDSKYFRDYDYKFFKKMDIKRILEIPFYYSTLNMLCEYHNTTEYNILNNVEIDNENIINRFYERNFERKSYYDEDERNSFNALTDGQNGDYDDWKQNDGDFDNLRD
jgi:hypothetical protein